MIGLAYFSNWKSLEAYINSAVKNTLQNEISEVIKDQLVESTTEIVYESHEPLVYNRRFSLTDKNNMNSELIDSNTLLVETVANPSDSVTGEWYESPDTNVFGGWVALGEVSPKPFGAGIWTTKRDFYEDAREKLNSSDDIKNATRKGLKRNGIQTD